MYIFSPRTWVWRIRLCLLGEPIAERRQDIGGYKGDEQRFQSFLLSRGSVDPADIAPKYLDCRSVYEDDENLYIVSTIYSGGELYDFVSRNLGNISQANFRNWVECLKHWKRVTLPGLHI